MREWAGSIGELCGVQYLYTSVLFAIEWRHNRVGLTLLAAKIERNFGIIEPETEMVLVRRRKRYGRVLVVAERD